MLSIENLSMARQDNKFPLIVTLSLCFFLILAENTKVYPGIPLQETEYEQIRNNDFRDLYSSKNKVKLYQCSFFGFIPHNQGRRFSVASNWVRFEDLSAPRSGGGKTWYQYYLEGYDSSWSSWTGERSKKYVRLKPGIYTFKVRWRADGDYKVNGIAYSFGIEVPFYLHGWVYILGILVSLSILFLVIKLRIRNYKREKSRIEQMIKERTAVLEREKASSEKLIETLLPKESADELRLTGKSHYQKYKMVTVLFSDIQGFTLITEQMNPEALIDQLDSFFFHFDNVVEKFNIVKIKTIGDAYMCAGGLPHKNHTNPVEVLLAALEMQQYMKELKKKNAKIWDLRIGIHTGEVIAGVIGQKKMSYDLWGDTVNTANRMESSGEPGKINISGQTYGLVRDYFICEYRGKMPVKYKGKIDMYFVKSIRPILSVNLKDLPNKRFYNQLQLLRILDLEEYIYNRLDKELPQNLYFHTTQKIKNICTIAEIFAISESVNEEELLLVKTAALMHDIGYIRQYSNHVEKSIELASEILPKFQYSPFQIRRILKLMNSIESHDRQPSQLEKILKDAFSAYMGRVDFYFQSENLFRELYERSHIGSRRSWNKILIQQLKGLCFYTKAAQKLQEVSPEEQIEKMKKL